MNDDFITGLRGDLLVAMERHETRRPVARAAAAVRGAGLRPLAAVAVAAIAVVALVFGIRHLPQPETTPAKLSTTRSIGGMPSDVAVGSRTLSVALFEGRMSVFDLSSGRRVSTVASPFQPAHLAAADGSVWLRGTSDRLVHGRLTSPMALVDIDSGRILRRIRTPGGGSVTATGGALWMSINTRTTSQDSVGRFDWRTGKRTATVSVPGISGIASGPDAVWAITFDGTLVRIDPARAEITHRWPQLAPPASTPTPSPERGILPEKGGAWVVSTGRREVLHIRGDAVVRVIALPGDPLPALARSGGDLWVASGDSTGGRNKLIRIDEASGEILQTLDLGTRRPVALAATSDGVWVVTGLGQLLRVAR
jgi:hypothetical protein